MGLGMSAVRAVPVRAVPVRAVPVRVVPVRVVPVRAEAVTACLPGSFCAEFVTHQSNINKNNRLLQMRGLFYLYLTKRGLLADASQC